MISRRRFTAAAAATMVTGPFVRRAGAQTTRDVDFPRNLEAALQALRVRRRNDGALIGGIWPVWIAKKSDGVKNQRDKQKREPP